MRHTFFILFAAVLIVAGCSNHSDNNNSEGASSSYVDLGLPSGTKWKSGNETGGEGGFYTYGEALAAFGDQLPTKEQFEELLAVCIWKWTGKGYNVKGGGNGNKIYLPAEGYRGYDDGGVGGVGSHGGYWSSTPYGSESAWRLLFNSGYHGMNYFDRYFGQSVRLVQSL